MLLPRRCYEILFGVVYALQTLVPTVDIYVGHWTDFTGAYGADDFLRTFHTGRVRHYNELSNFQNLYQMMTWTDHYGMDAWGADPGIRGMGTCSSKVLLFCCTLMILLCL